MADNRKQHYVPFAYLRAWAIDPATARADARVLRFGNGMDSPQEVPLDSQCQKANFYVADPGRKSEESAAWRRFEDGWGPLLARVRAANEISRPDLVRELFNQLLTLNLRNRAYDLDTDDVRLDAYRRLRAGFIHAAPGVADAGDDEVDLDDAWAMQLIASEQVAFITSDNPSVMFYGPDKQMYVCVAAPLDPHTWAFVHHSDFVDMNMDATEGERWDVDLLNQVQAVNSLSQVYSPLPFSPHTVGYLQKAFGRRSDRRGVIREEDALIQAMDIPAFSYLKKSANKS